MIRKTTIVLICVLFIILTIPATAQIIGEDSLPHSAASQGPSRFFIPQKTEVHVTAGTWFSTSSGYGNGWGTYISPSLSYNLSKRFSLSGGITLLNTTYSGYKPYYDILMNQPSYHGDVTSAYIYISGQYLVNDRLSISGTAFKKFNVYESPGSKNFFLNDEPYGGNLNIRYKIGENMFIEGGIGFTKGASNPYYGNPLYSPISPLYNPYFPGH